MPALGASLAALHWFGYIFMAAHILLVAGIAVILQRVVASLEIASRKPDISGFQSQPTADDKSVPGSEQPAAALATAENDWDPLSSADLQLLSQASATLGPRVHSLPVDILVQLVRSASTSPPGSLSARLTHALEWRRIARVDSLISEPPPRRAEYESLMPAGCIGHDGEGRPIILERPGRCRGSVRAALDSFSADEFVMHQVSYKECTPASPTCLSDLPLSPLIMHLTSFPPCDDVAHLPSLCGKRGSQPTFDGVAQVCSKECIRVLMAIASNRTRKRVYKFVSVVDCATVGTHHLDSRILT